MDAAQQENDLSPVVLSACNGALQHRNVIASSHSMLLVAEKRRRWHSTVNKKAVATVS
jgi:hypothetical protein